MFLFIELLMQVLGISLLLANSQVAIDESKVMHPFKSLNCKITTVHWYFDGSSKVNSSVVIAKDQKACAEQKKVISKYNPDPKNIKSVVVHTEWVAASSKKK